MLGYHVSKNGRTLPAAIAEEMAWLRAQNCWRPCAQVFVRGPQGYKSTITDADARVFGAADHAPLYVHGAYVDFVWNGKPAGRQNVVAELATCKLMGGEGVVIHLGTGAESPREALNDIFGRGNLDGSPTLFLETNAAPHERSFSDPDKLARLFEQIPRDIIPAIGICVDTAHLFSSGVNMTTREQAEQYLGDLAAAIEPYAEPKIIFHLNDSAGNFGTGKDEHASLTHGKIWSGFSESMAEKLGVLHRELFSRSGLAAVLEYAREIDTAVILERDDPRADVAFIKRIAND
jgi:endonuclease IV